MESRYPDDVEIGLVRMVTIFTQEQKGMVRYVQNFFTFRSTDFAPCRRHVGQETEIGCWALVRAEGAVRSIMAKLHDLLLRKITRTLVNAPYIFQIRLDISFLRLQECSNGSLRY